MRNFAIAVGVVILLAGSWFAIRHFRSDSGHAASGQVSLSGLEQGREADTLLKPYSPQMPSALDQTRETMKSVRAVKRRGRAIGSWRLTCNEAPARPPNSPPIQNLLEAHSAPVEAAGLVGVCSIATRVASPDLSQWIFLFMRPDGDNHSFTIGIRYPGAGPLGDSVDVKFDNRALRIPIVRCSERGCLAMTSVAGADTEKFSLARRVVAALTVRSGKRVEVNFPVDGFKDALIALRKSPPS